MLNLDQVYTGWAFGYDPVTQALRGLGVRNDRYRDLGSVTTANHFGGHELPGQRPDRLSNFIPNYTEYPIADSLASWYKIMIASTHTRTISEFNEQDASLAEQWWAKDTGSNQGDRCMFISGDDAMNTLLNTTGVVTTFQKSLATNVFGVGATGNAWAGSTSTPYPTMDDRFAPPAPWPWLRPTRSPTRWTAAARPNKFDSYVKASTSMRLRLPSSPNSRSRVSRVCPSVMPLRTRTAAAPGVRLLDSVHPRPGVRHHERESTRSGVENRMRVLCQVPHGPRARTSAPADTGVLAVPEPRNDARSDAG